MAAVSVKNHLNAINNIHAQFQKKITIQDVMNSQKIADPLKLLDASPITDGAAAVVLASEEFAKKLTDTPVWIKGSGHATDSISLHDREDITTLKATVVAAKQAYNQAKMNPSNIQTVEVHDCFSIAEILAIEDLGFIKNPELYHPLERIYQKVSHNLGIRKADKILAISEATKQDIIKYYPSAKNKIRVIYNGWDVQSFRPIKEDRKK